MSEVKQPMELWVDRLRSGTIEQGTGRLAVDTEDGHPKRMCCLGVACEVYREVTGQGEWVTSVYSDVGWRFEIGDTIADTHLPYEVAEWLGLPGQDSPEVFVASLDEVTALVELNDTHQWDFDMIADTIERTYLT